MKTGINNDYMTSNLVGSPSEITTKLKQIIETASLEDIQQQQKRKLLSCDTRIKYNVAVATQLQIKCQELNFSNNTKRALSDSGLKKIILRNNYLKTNIFYI